MEQKLQSMDIINTKEGDKVVYAFPHNGEERDRNKLTELGIMFGQEFTVAGITVHNWSSDLYLKEFPGHVFNSSNFANKG